MSQASTQPASPSYLQTAQPWLRRFGFLLFPLLALAAFLYLRRSDRLGYYRLVREDGVIEFTQALLFFFASIIAVLVARRLLQHKDRLLGAAFAFLSLGLFLVAAEEVSWGQRIIGFTTPPDIAEANIQREFTVHNLKALGNVVHKVMIAVGFFAVFGQLACRLVSSAFVRGRFGLVLVDWYVAPIFAPFLGIYVVYEYLNVFIEPHYGFPLVLWQDLETAEFFLASGFFAFAVSKLVQVRRCT